MRARRENTPCSALFRRETPQLNAHAQRKDGTPRGVASGDHGSIGCEDHAVRLCTAVQPARRQVKVCCQPRALLKRAKVHCRAAVRRWWRWPRSTAKRRGCGCGWTCAWVSGCTVRWIDHERAVSGNVHVRSECAHVVKENACSQYHARARMLTMQRHTISTAREHRKIHVPRRKHVTKRESMA
jgi:hypothetical protein